MVTKYSGYIHTPATRATGYVEDPNGSVVLASEYDALDEALNECIKDRDWFSDRLDAATAELARVKAESLRVVADGEARRYSVWLEQQSSTAFLLDDEVNVHVTINRYQSANGGPSAPIDGFVTVQPIRLERWEATDDHD